MQLYYTGATVPNQQQPSPELSLGGFVSSSPIGNADVNNLFPTITRTAILNSKKTIRMLALRNITGRAITELKIWTKSEKYSNVKMAVVSAALDEKQNPVFEKVANSTSIPFQATLDSCEGEENAIVVGDMEANETIGLWIQRELDQTKFTAADVGVTPDLKVEKEMVAYLADLNEKDVDDQIDIVFDFS